MRRLGGVPELPIERPSAADWRRLVTFLRDQHRHNQIHRNTTLAPGLAEAWQCLHAVTTFFERQPAIRQTPDCIAPLYKLYAALTDVATGTPSAMFNVPPRETGGDVGNNVEFESYKGLAAKALDLLMLARSTSLDDASRRVASACRPIPGYGQITGKMIKNWRGRLRRNPGRGAPKDGPARLMFQTKVAGAGHLEQAESLLAELRRLPPPVPPIR